MIKIEISRVGNEVRVDVKIMGIRSDIVDEVLCFHNNHVDMLKELIDRLPPDVELEVLMKILESTFDDSVGGDEK